MLLVSFSVSSNPIRYTSPRAKQVWVSSFYQDAFESTANTLGSSYLFVLGVLKSYGKVAALDSKHATRAGLNKNNLCQIRKSEGIFRNDECEIVCSELSLTLSKFHPSL